jgi:thiol-disulfide isomerase/thioredoxin
MIKNGIETLSFILLMTLVMIGCNSSEDAEMNQESQSNTQSELQTKAEYVEKAAFTDFEGDTVSISDFKGKVVMIDLWETWCKPCISSFPTLQKLQEDYPDDFAVLAVTPGFTDTKEDAQSFARENDYNFTYLMDSNELHKKLGVQGIPYKIFVDAEGNFIKETMGSYGPDEDYQKIKEIIENNRNLKE